MSPQELVDFMEDMDAKLKILNSKEAETSSLVGRATVGHASQLDSRAAQEDAARRLGNDRRSIAALARPMAGQAPNDHR